MKLETIISLGLGGTLVLLVIWFCLMWNNIKLPEHAIRLPEGGLLTLPNGDPYWIPAHWDGVVAERVNGNEWFLKPLDK